MFIAGSNHDREIQVEKNLFWNNAETLLLKKQCSHPSTSDL